MNLYKFKYLENGRPGKGVTIIKTKYIETAIDTLYSEGKFPICGWYMRDCDNETNLPARLRGWTMINQRSLEDEIYKRREAA